MQSLNQWTWETLNIAAETPSWSEEIIISLAPNFVALLLKTARNSNVLCKFAFLKRKTVGKDENNVSVSKINTTNSTWVIKSLLFFLTTSIISVTTEPESARVTQAADGWCDCDPGGRKLVCLLTEACARRRVRWLTLCQCYYRLVCVRRRVAVGGAVAVFSTDVSIIKARDEILFVLH